MPPGRIRAGCAAAKAKKDSGDLSPEDLAKLEKRRLSINANYRKRSLAKGLKQTPRLAPEDLTEEGRQRRFREKAARYRGNNLEKQRAWSRKYNKSVYDTNIETKLRVTLRNRINKVLCGRTKGGSAVRDLGCTVAELKLHIESLWLPGMSWENWTLHGWHIDHVQELCLFSLSDPDQMAAACHNTNLQPMWAIENITKGQKVKWERIKTLPLLGQPTQSQSEVEYLAAT